MTEMRKAVTYLFVILAFICVNLYLGVNFVRQFKEFRFKNGPLAIEVVDEDPAALRAVGKIDIDNNGEKEVIFEKGHEPDKAELLVFDPFEKEYIHTLNEIMVPVNYHFLNAYYDSRYESYVFRFLECHGNGIGLMDWKGPQETQKIMDFERPREKFFKEDGIYKNPVLVDLEQDGKKEMVIWFWTGYNRSPRGVACYDPENGELLWEYYSGTQMWEVEFKDLDSDNKREIILSTGAINNGGEKNGTSDAYSYVIVLDSNGKELWKRVTGDWYTFAQSDIADLDNDGTFDIVTAVECHRVNYENRGRLFIFDGKTGKQKRHFSIADASFSKPYADRLNETETRIYVGDSGGRIRMLDEHLNLMKEVEEDSPVLVLNSSLLPDHNNGVKKGSEWPYLFAVSYNRLLAYDRNLDRKILDHSLAKPFTNSNFSLLSFTFIPGKTKTGHYGVVSAKGLYQVSESKLSFTLILKNLLTTGLLLTIILLLLFNGVFIYFLYRLRNHHFSIPRKTRIDTGQFLEILQGIAHQLKNPISTILWTAEKIKRTGNTNNNKEKSADNSEAYRQLSGFLLDDVKTLRTQTGNMLKIIKTQKAGFEQKNLKPLLERIMKKSGMLIVIFLFSALNLYIARDCIHSTNGFNSLNKPVSIDPMYMYPSRFSGTLDVDHDGEDEVVYSMPAGISGHQSVMVFEPFKVDFQLNYYGDILVPLRYEFFDLYYDEDQGLYVFRFLDFEDGTFILKDIENNQKPRKSLKVKGLDLEFAHRGMDFFKPIPVDLDQDGKSELVTILKTDAGRSPGVIICIDPESRELLWKFETGPIIIDADFNDLDGNGQTEIVLSTYAANKGVEINGASDKYSYVIVLNSNGKKCWQKRLGRSFTYSHSLVSDLDGNGAAEIIASAEFHQKVVALGTKIVIFDGLSGEKKHEGPQFSGSFTKPLIMKSRNGPRIYVGDSYGNLWMFDRKLAKMEIIEVKEKTPVYALNASKGTNRWDYILAYTPGQLAAYDLDLKRRVFTYNFEPPLSLNDYLKTPILIPLNTKTGNHALLNSDKLYMLTESKISFSKRLENLVKSGLLINGLALLLFNGLFIFFFYRLRKTYIYRQRQRQSPIDTTQFIQVFQGIAHKIKTPLSTIMWTAEKIKRSVDKNEAEGEKSKTENYGQLADFLVEDVKILKQQTHNILKLIQIQKPRMEQKNLKPILERLVDHYRALLDKNIEIQLDMEEDITISMDENLIKEAIVNLVDNGIDAMPDGGKLTVSAVPVASPTKGGIGHVLIEVEDTGIGMEDEELSRLFEPFFTKKENGTGIGLTICKRIIEAHGGKIEVHSRKDFGTKIALIIR